MLTSASKLRINHLTKNMENQEKFQGNSQEQQRMEWFENAWKLHEGEIMEGYKNDSGYADSLLTRLQTLDSDDEVTIYHVVEEGDMQGDPDSWTSDKGVNITYRVSKLIEILTKAKEDMQLEKVKSRTLEIFQQSSEDDWRDLFGRGTESIFHAAVPLHGDLFEDGINLSEINEAISHSSSIKRKVSK